MTDIMKLIERLRKAGYDMHTDVYALLPEAVSAIEALQGEVERLKAFADLGVAMYEMTTTVHSPNIEFSEQLQIIPSLWAKCMEECDALHRTVKRVRKGADVYQELGIKNPKLKGTP